MFFIGYIPLDSIDNDVRCATRVKYLATKIFKLDKLVASFPGLDRSLMPLFATLTGNDFLDRSSVQKFIGKVTLDEERKCCAPKISIFKSVIPQS